MIKNLIFLVFFLLLASLGVFTFISSGIHFIGRPIWKVENSIKNNFENIGYVVRTKTSVYKENENLLKENVDLKQAMIDYRILKNENVSLKELFGRVPNSDDMVLANILTRPNYSPYDTIILDIGNDIGIKIGDRVYGNVLTPIGEVSAIYKNTSLVTLYSNPGKVTEAIMEGSNTNVEIVGRGGGNFEMIIPIDLPFVKGASLLLPNIKSEIVAIIEDVISSPNDPVKKVLLSSPVNVQNLKWVFVKRN
ncbi:MAG: rod shape-determining protein MreC [Candidatus Paceibacterota bacterium]